MQQLYYKKKDKGQIFLKRIFLTIPFLAFLFIILVVFFVATVRVSLESREIYKSRKEKEAVFDAEKRKNEELTAQISEIQTETGKEKHFRKEFPVKKPGEDVVVIITPEQELKPKKEDNIIKNLFNRFFRK